MPEGKAAGLRRVQLTPENRCALFGRRDRPAVCLSYRASDSCGANREEAMQFLEELERLTSP